MNRNSDHFRRRHRRRTVLSKDLPALPPGRSILGGTLMLLAIFLCAGARAAEPTAIPGYVAVGLSRSGNHLVIVVKVNGHEMPLGLDTGTPLTVLSESAYEYSVPAGAESNLPAGIARSGKFNGQRSKVGWVADFRAGDMNFGSGPVGVTDMSMMHRSAVAVGHSHERLEGLLGMDVLTKYAAIIDPSRSVVYFNTDPARRAHLGPTLAQGGWTAIPMQVNSHRHLTVPTEIAGHSFRLIVDSGAYTTEMDTDRLASLNISTSQTFAFRQFVNTETKRARAYIIKGWKIGDYTIPSFPVAVFGLPMFLIDDHSSGASIAGLLGEDVLLINHAFIDIGGGMLYLHPY